MRQDPRLARALRASSPPYCQAPKKKPEPPHEVCQDCGQSVPLKPDGKMRRHHRRPDKDPLYDAPLYPVCKQRKRTQTTCPDHPLFELGPDGACPVDDSEMNGPFTAEQLEAIEWLFAWTVLDEK
jgi:hypothetical protein